MTNFKLSYFLTIPFLVSSISGWAMEHDNLRLGENRSPPLVTPYVSLSPHLITLSSFAFLQATPNSADGKQEASATLLTNFIRQGLACYQNKDFEKAKDYFLQGAQAGSAQSMSWYGTILKDQSQTEEAFYWQRLALITSILTGKLTPLPLNKLKELQALGECPETIKRYIHQILKTDFQKVNLPHDLNQRMTVIANTLLLPEKDCFFYSPLMEQQYLGLAALTDNPYIHLKVCELLFFRGAWSSEEATSNAPYVNKAREHASKAKDLAREGNFYLREADRIIGEADRIITAKEKGGKYNILIKVEDEYKYAAKLLRKFRTPTTIEILARLIADKKINEDEDDNPIPEDKRIEVVARLCRICHSRYYLSVLGRLIATEEIHEDENGNPFSEERRYEIAARLMILDPQPQELEVLIDLILTQKIHQDEKGQSIAEGQRYEVVARLCRQLGTPDALNALAKLIWKEAIHTDEENNFIPPEKRVEVAYRLLKKSGTPESLFLLAEHIEENLIHKDERGRFIPENKRYEVAARLYRLSGIPQALYNLARLIAARLVSRDGNNRPMSEVQRYEEAARLLRQVKTSWAILSLAALIEAGHLHTDENGNAIPKKKRYQVAARLYRQSQEPRGLAGLARLINMREIHEDENSNPIITEEDRCEVIARLYRNAGSPEALCNLATMIMHDFIHADENNELFPEGKRYEVVTRLLRSSGLPSAYYYLAILKLSEEATLENKKEAMQYALLAARGGSKKGEELYEVLHAEIGEKEDLATSQILSIDEEEKEAEEEIIPLEKRSELKKLKKLQRPKSQNKLGSKERQKIFRRLIAGQSSEAERRQIIDVSHQVGSQPKISVLFSKRAEEELNQLPPQEKKKVFRLVRDLREEIPSAHQKPLRHTKEKSRRITKKGRLVYYQENNIIKIKSCKGHYDD